MTILPALVLLSRTTPAHESTIDVHGRRFSVVSAAGRIWLVSEFGATYVLRERHGTPAEYVAVCTYPPHVSLRARFAFAAADQAGELL